MERTVTIGMVGAGRATELHMEALSHVRGVNIRLKKIMAGHIENAKKGQETYGFEEAVSSIEDMLDDPEIDVIDICSPPYTHDEYVIGPLEAGKYVICEKPLTGYFGLEDDPQPIGTEVSKEDMYKRILDSLDKLSGVVDKYPRHFMYAENFVYAPAVQKAAEIIRKKKSKILCAKGEESLKGSSSRVAGEWNKTGGGTFTRTGSHPLSAILWLKTVEAQSRNEEIHVDSIMADMDQITPYLNEYEHRHIAARPHDVEDFGTSIISFSDHTKAVIMATDTLLGGSRNYVELYCNDAVINCKLTMTDAMQTYFLDEDRLDDVYISEMLPSKIGWNSPFIEDVTMRGYIGEMQDFMEAVAYDREPLSNFKLAYDTAKLTYAAYYAGEIRKAVEL